jgi:hypothetical protein
MGVCLCLGLCFCSLLDGWRARMLRNQREYEHCQRNLQWTSCRIIKCDWNNNAPVKYMLNCSCSRQEGMWGSGMIAPFILKIHGRWSVHALDTFRQDEEHLVPYWIGGLLGLNPEGTVRIWRTIVEWWSPLSSLYNKGAIPATLVIIYIAS